MSNNDTASRNALEDWIVSRLGLFGYHELKTIAVRVERMAKAISDYGHLDLRADRRIWKLEGAYEGVDRGWYDDAELVFDHDPAFADIRALREAERKRERQERLRCFIADQHFGRVDGVLNEFASAVGTPNLDTCEDCHGAAGEHRKDCPWILTVPPGAAL